MNFSTRKRLQFPKKRTVVQRSVKISQNKKCHRVFMSFKKVKDIVVQAPKMNSNAYLFFAGKKEELERQGYATEERF